MYHGSPYCNLGIIIPQNNTSHRDDNKKAVYASSNLSYAACYMIAWDDSFVKQIIKTNEDGDITKVIMIVLESEEEFKRKDNGGTISKLSKKGFQNVNGFELVNYEATIPISRTTFSSALEAMENLGVKIYYTKKDVLFHGSSNNNISHLMVNNNRVRDADEGAVIFATPLFELSICFIIKWTDLWVNLSISRNGSKYNITMVIADEQRFRNEAMRGGTVYILPSKDFKFHSQKGLKNLEYTSKIGITPICKVQVENVLKMMKDHDVKIYFMNDQQQFYHYAKLCGEEQEFFIKRNRDKFSEYE